MNRRDRASSLWPAAQCPNLRESVVWLVEFPQVRGGTSCATLCSMSPEPAPTFAPPTAEEALARLDMPLVEAMRTQRAVRRLHLDPVDDDGQLATVAVARENG